MQEEDNTLHFSEVESTALCQSPQAGDDLLISAHFKDPSVAV